MWNSQIKIDFLEGVLIVDTKTEWQDLSRVRQYSAQDAKILGFLQSKKKSAKQQNMTQIKDELISAKEAARMIGCSVSYISNLVGYRELDIQYISAFPQKQIKPRYYIYKSSVVRYIENRKRVFKR